MRVASLSIASLTLILLVMIPVGGAPASLQKGSHAAYHLSASIAFSPPVCEPNPATTTQAAIICPMIVSLPSTVRIAGTLEWTATNRSSTTVDLNVTQDLMILPDASMAMPTVNIVRSFNESIDLATRIVSIMPFIMPEIDEALQVAGSGQGTSLPANLTLNSAMNTIEPPLSFHPVRTMWWVNGPLEANQTVQVLVFPTNVTGLTSIDLGSLGTRQAWALVFKPRPLSLPQPERAGTSSAIPIYNSLQTVFTFNYDKTSDLLLSASADIHLGFASTLQVQCDPNMFCPSMPAPAIVQTSGLDIHASLILTTITNLSLDQPVTPTGSSGGTGSSGSGSGTGAGTGSGTGTGGTTGAGSGGGAGSGYGQGSGSGAGSNSGSNPQPASPAPSAGVPIWIYWTLGVVAMAMIASGLWVGRRRTKTRVSKASPFQSIN